MEVSSHGLVQNRVTGVPFYIAIFSNITQDHLDYHNSMKEYESAKWLLFSTHRVKKIILNADDKYGQIWLKKLYNYYTISVTIQNSKQKKYSTKWINATRIKIHKHVVYITFESSWGTGRLLSRLIGKFNVTNLLLSLGCLLELGHNLSDVICTSFSIKPICGRMEVFNVIGKPMFIIDYAHTPDALKKTLKAVRSHYKKYIWCIFGCGGERDKKKRYLMGNIAEKIADKVILTNDNPRNENEMKIIKSILSGCKNKANILIIPDRKTAIYYAYSHSKNNSIIIVTGKGHENYQIIKNKYISYSDKKTIQYLLEKRHDCFILKKNFSYY